MSEGEQDREAAVAEPLARAPIRRFDVFAEYNFLRNEAKGMPEAAAKGEALWLAKLVAARKFATTAERKARVTAKLKRKPGVPAPAGARTLEGKPQTAALFDREIVDRMGPDFYARVFAPAIAHAYHSGEKYEAIRDRIRAPWNLKRKGL
ncbi:MAG TPA: hypothetical protein VFZ25_04700 [Chloroflexota bacterium]|nr:hypothetical protein [Chloroflexota bacterium]